MKVERESITFLNAVQYRLLPTKTISTLDSSPTPSVANCEFWICSNGAITITNFLDGQICQRLFILGNSLTTISNNTNIKTNTGANKLLLTNKVYRFTLFNLIWVEDE
jgi:hypothetical protein